MSDPEDLTFSQLELCSYRYLQQMAKSMSLPCNVKKVYLIELIRAKKYSSPETLEAIIGRIKHERKQNAQIKKPKRKKKTVQGTEISSTSNSHSPPLTLTPKRSPSYVITYPPSKYQRLNILRPPGPKKAVESDRVLRSFNTRMRPNYSIMNVNSSVLGVIKAQNALQRSQEERQYPMSVFQRQQLFVSYPQTQKAIGYGDEMQCDDEMKRLVPLVRRSNIIVPRPAIRNRKISGIYPLNSSETMYRCTPINCRRQDGRVSKLNAFVQKHNDRSLIKRLVPLQDIIPNRTVSVKEINFENDGNSSTESANSNIERQILAENANYQESVDKCTQTVTKRINRKEKVVENNNYVKSICYTENLNHEPEVLIHTVVENAGDYCSENVQENVYADRNYGKDNRYTERVIGQKDSRYKDRRNRPSDYYSDSQKYTDFRYTENQHNAKNYYAENQINNPKDNYYTENRRLENFSQFTETRDIPKDFCYPENLNNQPENVNTFIKRTENLNDVHYAEDLNNRQENSSFYIENRNIQEKLTHYTENRNYTQENFTHYTENRNYTQEHFNHDTENRNYTQENFTHDTENRNYTQVNFTHDTENRNYTQENFTNDTENRNYTQENFTHDTVNRNYTQENFTHDMENQNNRYTEGENMETQIRNEDYPNMSALTDVYPENDITELSSNTRGDFTVYYHKKIRAEQVRTQRSSLMKESINTRPVGQSLPKIADVFSQFNDTQYKHLAQPLYVQVSKESERMTLNVPLNNTMLECIYNINKQYLPSEPVLLLATTTTIFTTNNTTCVYSTPVITTAVQHRTAAPRPLYPSFEQPNPPYHIETETMPRLYDYMKMAEQERRDLQCNEVLSQTVSVGSNSPQELGANVTIPDMVEDALELISQDGDYMERIGMDVRMKCIACDDWAGPKTMLETHIRKEHNTIITEVKSEWCVTLPLANIWFASAHKTYRVQEDLFIVSAACVRPHSLHVVISILPTVEEDIPKFCSITVYKKMSREPYTWEGEILQLLDKTPYENENGLKLDINSLNLFPNGNIKVVDDKLVSESTNLVIDDRDLVGIDIMVYIKVFD